MANVYSERTLGISDIAKISVSRQKHHIIPVGEA